MWATNYFFVYPQACCGRHQELLCVAQERSLAPSCALETRTRERTADASAVSRLWRTLSGRNLNGATGRTIERLTTSRRLLPHYTHAFGDRKKSLTDLELFSDLLGGLDRMLVFINTSLIAFMQIEKMLDDGTRLSCSRGILDCSCWTYRSPAPHHIQIRLAPPPIFIRLC